MNYDELGNISKWTLNFWDPNLSPLSTDVPAEKIYENYHNDPHKTYKFNFFETDDRVVNPYFKDKEITYTFNAHGYRSNSFLENKKIKIVLLGCSQTFGLGLDDSDIWSHHLINLLQQKFNRDDIGVYNLGTPSASSGSNLVQFYQLVDIIKPDFLLWMPPSLDRFDVGVYSNFFTEDIFDYLSGIDSVSDKKFEHDSRPFLINDLDRKWVKSLPKKYQNMIEIRMLDKHTQYQDHCRNLAFIRTLCDQRNIKFYCFIDFITIVGMFDNANSKYKRADIKFNKSLKNIAEYYVNQNQKNIIKMETINELIDSFIEHYKNNNKIKEKYPSLENLHYLARDGAHAGGLFHYFMSYISHELLKEDIAKLLNTT